MMVVMVQTRSRATTKANDGSNGADEVEGNNEWDEKYDGQGLVSYGGGDEDESDLEHEDEKEDGHGNETDNGEESSSEYDGFEEGNKSAEDQQLCQMKVSGPLSHGGE